MALEQEITTIQEIYKQKREEEKELWKPFNIEAEKLEKIVLDKFNEVLKEIGPVKSSWIDEDGGAEVLDSKCKYYPEINEFYIKILNIKTPFGIIGEKDQDGCPHVYLEPITGFVNVNPKIIKFMEEYHISHIKNPPNHCKHK
ncbi:MAG: hypothetical protein NT139_00745 [Candidatus Woesearchaeota archaeon]|nr:hypothetical protein [Candidatus Woesearchaeota archaeon]